MSPRSNVMSPAKPMQAQNVSNNPLSPHGHLTGKKLLNLGISNRIEESIAFIHFIQLLFSLFSLFMFRSLIIIFNSTKNKSKQNFCL